MGHDYRSFRQLGEDPAQSRLHLSELRGKDSVDDLHDELNRATAEGFSMGYKDTGSHAQRRVDSAADG